MLVSITKTEWYPVFDINYGKDIEKFGDPLRQMSKEEIDEIEKVFEQFGKIQKMLKNFYYELE